MFQVTRAFRATAAGRVPTVGAPDTWSPASISEDGGLAQGRPQRTAVPSELPVEALRTRAVRAAPLELLSFARDKRRDLRCRSYVRRPTPQQATFRSLAVALPEYEAELGGPGWAGSVNDLRGGAAAVQLPQAQRYPPLSSDRSPGRRVG